MFIVKSGVVDISLYMSFIQIAIDTISDRARISASHDDLVTLFCLYDLHNIGPRPKVKYKPRQVPTHSKVIGNESCLFLHIWSKSMLYGIWDENMHEVLIKMMRSNHSNTLPQSLKLPSCHSENYEGKKWRNCAKLGWYDRPWRECQEYYQFQCLYEGLCWSCDHVLKWPWPCLQRVCANSIYLLVIFVLIT